MQLSNLLIFLFVFTLVSSNVKLASGANTIQTLQPALSIKTIYSGSATTFLTQGSSGEIYFSDSNNHVVRRISNGSVEIFAGTFGVSGFTGDGSYATSASLSSPSGLAFLNGILYIGDQ